MPIRYVHNDPRSVPFLETETVPLPDRKGALAKYRLADLAAEQLYPLDSPGFVDWQCREAALRTIAAWELVAQPLRFWHNDQRIIDLLPRRATALAASYERTSLGFGHWPAGNPTFFVGASTDAVSHEVGHAILDARRPALWESLFGEVAAFHEGFADCMSLLVALFDDAVVTGMFASAPRPEDVLHADNPAAQVAESVAAAVTGAFGAQHPASRPRRLKNNLQWAIPTTLPPNPTANNLSREPHSFGRVFSGCFYDCVDNIYRSAAVLTPSGLQQAAHAAGALLAEAVQTAPEEIRFFRAIGRAMIHADSRQNDQQNHLAIRDAFAAHNVALGSSAALGPTMSLAGPSPLAAVAGGRTLNARTRKDLASRTGAERGVRVSVSADRIAGKKVVRAALKQKVKLKIPGQKGVAVLGGITEEVLLGEQQQRCVLLGELPNKQATEEEVGAFVETLTEGGELESSPQRPERSHGIRRRGRQRTLRRLRFSCNPD